MRSPEASYPALELESLVGLFGPCRASCVNALPPIFGPLSRLPEFYGPSVASLTTRVFRASLADRRALWPGPLDVSIELVYMPDAARVLIEVASAADFNAPVFHLPGARTTPRQFVELVYQAAGRRPRVFSVPRWLLSAGGVFDATARGAADIGHLWTHPILLDGTKYTARFGAIPRTPLADSIATTLAWHRAHPELRLQA
jgi:nucleoside-diphosphate-sugar epimerase